MPTVRLPDELVARVDVQRGGTPRERWIREALDEYLEICESTVAVPEQTVAPSGQACRHRPQARTPWGKCKDCGAQVGMI